MSKSQNSHIRVNLGGKTLLAIALYSALMMAAGAMLKSCNERYAAAEKIQNPATAQQKTR